MNITLILSATVVGFEFFIIGLVTDALLQADFIRQKDEQIRELKKENEAIKRTIYRGPDFVDDGRYARPVVGIIELPQADKTYHMPW